MSPPNATILVVDDEPDLLSLLDDYLSDKGYTVTQAENGVTGLKMFRNMPPDLILTDIVMPNGNGLDFLKAVVEEKPELPILVISGEGELKDAIKALRLGAWNYLVKPIVPLSNLLHAVEQALAKATLLKENAAYRDNLEALVEERTQELAQSEKRLSAIIESFEGYIFTCDADCRVTFMNKALKEHLGRDIVGQPCHEIIFGRNDSCPWCLRNPVFPGDTITEEFFHHIENRWYKVIHSPVVDVANTVIQRQTILRDITDAKNRMLALQEREEYLRKENLRLRDSLKERYRFGPIIGKSAAMQEVYESIISAAGSNASVIIYGESGTGKELVAEAIHEKSDRSKHRLVFINCGAVPENLIESEFFGYTKGAFTGADKDKHGVLDLADGGTLFLDEVGEIPLNMQVKLLRAIEGGGFMPVGGSKLKKPDVRIIAATSRNLKEMAREGLIRHDFFYRIHIIPIYLPPLRDRKEDIALLIEHFLSQYEADKIPAITSQMYKSLQDFSWPGNVRELQNTIYRFVNMKKLDFSGLESDSHEELFSQDDIFTGSAKSSLVDLLEKTEKKIIIKAFEKNAWHQGKTAETLKVDRKTLYRKMKQHNISKP